MLFLFASKGFIYGQDAVIKDSTTILSDSLSLQSDTINTIKKPKKNMVDAEVSYSASDSIVLSPEGQKFFLYGNAAIKYRDIDLKAAYIELDMDSTTAYACGVKDSSGVVQGLPVFTDKNGTYTMNTMKYNFKTQKAVIEHVVTEQGEGYVVSSRSKKMEDNTFYIKKGHYSTCDNHDCPHFYLHLTKAKFIPGKKIITGPAYLVLEDVPIYPLFIPFALIPTTSKYSSGVIMPTYGTETQRGLFLREGGYYWAASNYFDLATTGDIYTNGSWGLQMASKYKWKYHLSGNFSFRTITNIISEKDLPDYSKTKDMAIRWSHSPDAKANPYSSLSASVDYSTSSFEKNNIQNVVNTQQLATNTKRSSISYSKRFPVAPVNFSVNLLHSQNSRDTTIDLTIPDFTLTVSKISPFKQKNRVGEERWFEKINLSYTGTTKNYIHAKEFELKDKSFVNDWQNGVKHSVPLSMNLKFLKFFTASPSVNYTERWYFKSIEKTYDYDKQRLVTSDTIRGFNRVYDYSLGVGTSTKAYMFYTPDKRVFGDKVKAFRHVMTPSVGFSFAPDFGSPRYGYYNQIEYYDAKSDTVVHYQYSRYENAIYGTPSPSKSGNISFSLGNTFDMKVKDLKDSTGVSKIALLEGLSFSSGYNILADSLNFSRVNMSGRTTIKGVGINFGGVFDGYAMDTTSRGTPVRVDRSYFKESGKPLRLESFNFSFGISLNNSKFKKNKDGESNVDSDSLLIPGEPVFDPNDPMGLKNKQKGDMADKKMVKGDDGYAKFAIPWTLSLNYSFRLIQDKFNKSTMTYDLKPTSDLNCNGTIDLTKKWKIGFSSGYNFEYKEFTQTNVNITKDLHCWTMSFNLVPTGAYKSFFFTIRVNSSMLQDLKYEKRSSPRDKAGFY